MEPPVKPPVRVDEIAKRAVFLWAVVDRMGTPRPPDRRLLWQVWEADSWRVSVDPARVADAHDRRDEAMDRADRQEIVSGTKDWATDNRRQIRSFIGRSSIISTPVRTSSGESR